MASANYYIIYNSHLPVCNIPFRHLPRPILSCTHSGPRGFVPADNGSRMLIFDPPTNAQGYSRNRTGLPTSPINAGGANASIRVGTRKSRQGQKHGTLGIGGANGSYSRWNLKARQGQKHATLGIAVLFPKQA